MTTNSTESEIIFLVTRTAEGGYTAHALGHAIFTQADTIDELWAMVRDALVCHFDAPIPARLVFGSGSK